MTLDPSKEKVNLGLEQERWQGAALPDPLVTLKQHCVAPPIVLAQEFSEYKAAMYSLSATPAMPGGRKRGS